MPDCFTSPVAVPVEGTSSTRNLLPDLLLLTKARVNVSVVGTAFVGFGLNAAVFPNWLLLLHTLGGTALTAGAAAAANQVLEYRFDRTMVRTRNRPLAAGRLGSRTAIILTTVLFGAGCLWLGCAVNGAALVLAILTFAVYVFAYTPMKRSTPFCTVVGAVSGALPLLIGWAATEVALERWTAIACGVLFLWQIPHFLAIAWRRKTDYANGGFKVLPRNDRDGHRTACLAVAGTVAMTIVSLTPAFLGGAAWWYLAGGAALGMAMLFFSIQFLRKRSEASARSLYIASLYYLSCLYFLMFLIPRMSS